MQNAAIDPKEADFGKYRLLRRLAQGGMAEIFLATQRGIQGFEKSVVIKRVLPNLSASDDFINMFLDEARIAARLEHPNIVRIYDLGEVNGQYYIAMEYIAGEDLASVIQQAKRHRVMVPCEFAADAVLGAAEALMFAHDMEDAEGKLLNLVHRDVSPSNILVTYQGSVKLVDFGIARAETNVSKTEGGQVKGKIQYLSPEQCRGQRVDGRTDIYALGIVLHELLTCRRLFQRDNALLTMNAILSGQVDPPSVQRPDVPPELDDIVLKALQKETEDRYQSAAELAADLSVFLMGRGWNRGTDSVDFLTRLFGEPRKRAKLRVAKGQKLDESGFAASTSVPSPGSVAGPGRSATGELEAIRSDGSGSVLAVTPGGSRPGSSAPHPVRPPTSPSQEGVRPPSSPSQAALKAPRPPSDPNAPPASQAVVPSAPRRPTHSSLPRIPSIPPMVPPVAPMAAAPSAPEAPAPAPPEASAPPAPAPAPAGFPAVVLAGLKRKDPKFLGAAAGAVALILAIVVLSTGGEAPQPPPPAVQPAAQLPADVRPRPSEPKPAEPKPTEPAALPPGLQVGGVRFTGLPEGARVTVDGNMVANPGGENFFAAGVRQVKVESRAHLPFEGTVNVVVGKVTDVPVALKPRPVEARGAIEIACQPWCQITLDGRDTGKTSPARISAGVGQHTLVLSNPPAGLAKKITVTVTENGVVRKSVKLDD